MRRNLLVAAVCILTLPMWFSHGHSENQTNATPYAVVAIAGHAPVGFECRDENCSICNGPDGVVWSPGDDDESAQTDDSGLDFDSGALLLALAFIMWTRLRA